MVMDVQLNGYTLNHCIMTLKGAFCGMWIMSQITKNKSTLGWRHRGFKNNAWECKGSIELLSDIFKSEICITKN
jgi:hypothetical protein